jgi:hypothetical protein
LDEYLTKLCPRLSCAHLYRMASSVNHGAFKHGGQSAAPPVSKQVRAAENRKHINY